MSLPSGPVKWAKILAQTDVIPSISEAERLIKQGGFEINGALVQDPACKLDLDEKQIYQVRVGKKKFLRIVVE